MIRLLLAHLRAGRGALMTITTIVAALAMIAVTVPLAVTAMLDSSTRYRLDGLHPVVRDLSASGPFRPEFLLFGLPTPPEPDEVWIPWDESIDAIREEASPLVRDVFGKAQYYTRLGTPGEYTSTTYVMLDPRYTDRIEIEDGRLPEQTVTAEEWDEKLAELWNPETGEPVVERVEMPATEIVLSVESAAEVEWEIGQTRTLGEESGWFADVPLTLVGTFEARDAADPYWAQATGVLTASKGSNPDGVPYVRTTAYAAPATLRTLPTVISGDVQTEVWMPADTDTVTAAGAPALLADLRDFVARSHPLEAAGGFTFASLQFHTGSIDTLEKSVAQNSSLVAVLAMLMSGPLGVALAVLILGCRMLWETRRTALALLSARGASGGQLRRLLAFDGLLAGVVPAGVGAVAGILLMRIVAPEVPPAPALLVLPAVLALLPATVGAVTATRMRDRQRADSRAGSVWRAIVDVGVALLAALATALLVLRGDASTDTGIDPLAAAAPLLLSLAACVVTLRLYPLVLRLVLRSRQKGRGFVGMLGAARALRDPATGIAPVLALIVGVTFAVAGGVLLSIVQHGAEQTARAGTGADLQVQVVRLPAGGAAAIGQLDGVATVAEVQVVPAVELSIDHKRSRVSLYLVDQDAFEDAQRGYPAVIAPGVDLGDGTGSPQLFTSDVVARRGLPAAGEIEIGMAKAEFAGSAPGIAPFATNTAWALADRAFLAEITDRPATTASVFVRLTDDADVDAVTRGISEIAGPAARISTAEDALAAIDADPAISGLRVALLAGVAGSAVLSAVAVVVTLVLGARGRRRILALLQTLGAPPRAGRRLLVWELAPAGIAALVVGTVFGAVLPVLLGTVIDLRNFTGGAQPPPYSIDPGILAATLGGFIAVTALVTLVALAVARRARVAAVLRTVEDT